MAKPDFRAMAELEVYPYGNGDLEGNSITCQHGSDECLGNQVGPLRGLMVWRSRVEGSVKRGSRASLGASSLEPPLLSLLSWAIATLGIIIACASMKCLIPVTLLVRTIVCTQSTSLKHLPAQIIACMQKKYPMTAKDAGFFPAFACMEGKDGKPVDEGQACATEHNLDWAAIQSCATGSEGKGLALQAAQATESLSPAHEYAPWVTLNGKPLRDDAYNLVEKVPPKFRILLLLPLSIPHTAAEGGSRRWSTVKLDRCRTLTSSPGPQTRCATPSWAASRHSARRSRSRLTRCRR